MSKLNFASKTVWTGDNLEIMRGINSECIDLVYLDPPFNSRANYAAPIGSPAAGAAFKDTWTLSDIDVEWINLVKQKHPDLHRMLQATITKSDKSYLAYMAPRLLEIKRLLKPTGSIWLHCDPTMSHYLKLVMDAIFGRKNYRNEVVWSYRTGGASRKTFAKKHDSLLFYSVSDTYTFNQPREKAYTKSKSRKAGKVDYGGGVAEFHEDQFGVYNEVVMRDVWEISYINSQSKERTGYPTQKPLELLGRIIQASSNEGDLVLDPFCGCATTCVSASIHHRDWAGIDISPKAGVLVKQRLSFEVKAPDGKQTDMLGEITVRKDIPQRTDIGKISKYNSPENRKKLYGEQAGHCAGCGDHFEARHLEVDHIIAKSKGGTDHLSNLQLLCGNCNRLKGNRGMEYLQSVLNMVT